MKHWAHYLERNSCDKMIYWGLGDCNVLPTRYNSAFKNPIKKLVRNGTILLNKAFRIDILLVVGEIPSTLTLEALEAINKIVADALGRQPTIHVSLHPKALLADKNLEFIRKCKKIGYTTSCGISSEKHVSSRLVIYDSIQHTLMYERVIHNNPFLIIENPNVQVDLCFDLAAEFLKLLVEKSIYIKLGDIKSIDTIFSAYPPTCANTFRAKFAAARSIIMRNPTLQTFSRSSYTQKHS